MADFRTFAEAHGLIIDRLLDDGQIHVCRTQDKPRKKNGRYLLRGDWGWIQDHAQHLEPVYWRAEGNAQQPMVSQARVAELARQRAETRQQEAEKYARGAARAAEIIARCETGTHPYFIRKGFSAHQCLIDPADGRAVIPIRPLADYGRVASLQFIAADGEKKMLWEGEAGGGVQILGNHHARASWLCEGMATGLSVLAGLAAMHRDDRVIVCFSAGNIVKVAPMVRGTKYLVADHDLPNPKTGTRAGHVVVETVKLPWTMPDTEDTDANDVHQKEGIWSLVKLLRRALAPP